MSFTYPQGYIDAVWSAFRAGRLTAAELQSMQDLAAPRCERHDKPIKAYQDGRPMCEVCVEEEYSRR